MSVPELVQIDMPESKVTFPFFSPTYPSISAHLSDYESMGRGGLGVRDGRFGDDPTDERHVQGGRKLAEIRNDSDVPGSSHHLQRVDFSWDSVSFY